MNDVNGENIHLFEAKDSDGEGGEGSESDSESDAYASDDTEYQQ